MDAALLSELTAMGFNENRATRALHTTGTSSMEQAINWIMEHENDEDIDTPLLVRAPPPPESMSVWPCVLMHTTRSSRVHLTVHLTCWTLGLRSPRTTCTLHLCDRYARARRPR